MLVVSSALISFGSAFIGSAAALIGISIGMGRAPFSGVIFFVLAQLGLGIGAVVAGLLML